MMTFAFVWYQNDPQTALAAITSAENPARNDVITMLTSSLGGTNSELVINWLTRQDRALQNELMPELLGNYAQVDPRAALNQATTLQGELRSKAERNIIHNWATVEPRAAIDWVLEDRQQPDHVERLTDAVRTFAWRAPEESIAWAVSIEEQELRESALISIATTGAHPHGSSEQVAPATCSGRNASRSSHFHSVSRCENGGASLHHAKSPA